MAGIKTLVLLLVANHATAEPCTTVGPAPKAPAPCTTVGPTQPPANPCTPHAPGPAPKPLPPTTCATYNCPKAPWVKIANPEASFCSSNRAGGTCTNQYCCRCMTTTPKPVVYKPTCATYTCPTWWTADATKATVKCPAGGCSRNVCCKLTTTTLIVTTTPTTCKQFQADGKCKKPWENKPIWVMRVCPAGGCTPKDCCACATTTPKPPPVVYPTCESSYVCPQPGWVADKTQAKKQCGTLNVGKNPNGGCDRRNCCLMVTTTPVPTTTPTTCAKFNCKTPWEVDPTKLTKICPALGCVAKDCCLCKTTTPKPITCAAYMCEQNPGWVTDATKKNKECQGANVGGAKTGMDAAPGCDRRWCCKFLTTTPVPTTTPQTCATFPCKPPLTLVAFSKLKICPTTGCSPSVCCVLPTTTPKPPVVPTPTCASPAYVCAQGWKPKGVPMPKINCPVGGCNRNVCCDIVITTTPTPPPTCATFTCLGDHWVTRDRSFLDMVCTAGKCTKEQCCFHKTTTTLPTRCSSWACRGVWTPKAGAASEKCYNNVCSDMQCCECLTTTPAPTTTPPTYCSSWTCNTPWDPKPNVATIPCTNNICSNKQCCLCQTTTPAPTSPPPTCGSWNGCGGLPWQANPARAAELCDGGVCTKKFCCLCVTTTPAPTSPPPTCASWNGCGGLPWQANPLRAADLCRTGDGGVCTKKFCCLCVTTTPAPTSPPPTCGSWNGCGGLPWQANPLRAADLCRTGDGGVCTKKFCCLCVTTTPAPTSPPAPTCGSFYCGPAPWGPAPGLANTPCTGGVCAKKQCCKCLTTTPGATQAPSPCTTAAPARLYSAQQKQAVFQEAKKDSTNSYGALFGMFALISVGCGVVVYKRSRRTGYTRAVSLGASLTDDEDIEAIE